MSSVFWNPSSQTWKRVGYFGLLGIVVVTSLVGGAALFIAQSKVSPQAIVARAITSGAASWRWLTGRRG